MHLTITGIDGPRELAEKTPLAIKLIREMPGPDRPDYWLGVLDSPINIGTENHEREVTHLIVSARWAGTRIMSGVRRLPLGIAYVTDPSLLNDSSLDFAKCRYVAIGVGSVTSDGTPAKSLLKRVLLISTIVVAASTCVLPFVGGYGTGLFQVVVLGAWAILAAITSGRYADLHHAPLWIIALSLNLLMFAVPAGLLLLASRRKWPTQGAVAIAVWCALYLCCLFFLFPATDGP